MSDIDTLTIGQAREAIARGKEIEKLFDASDRTHPSSPCVTAEHGMQIVILDRGFVYVGNVSISGDWLLIKNANNVRRWGTTKGLGELAKSGPLEDTILDPAGIVRAPLRALIGLVECEASSWKK